MKHSAAVPRRGGAVMAEAHQIRERLSNALRLVDEAVGEPEPRRREQPMTERYVRTLIRFRRDRGRFFDAALFADPAWDILLELYAAELGQQRVSVGSLCVGAAVPATTALRWIAALENKGLICRTDDPMDGRRVFIALAPNTARALDAFFASLSEQPLLV